MARIRTFIAVDVGDAIRSRLVALQEKLSTGGDMKWVEPENLHVTLLFLGEVDERDVLDVCRAVSVGCGRVDRFALTVAGVGCFGSPRRPRTIWAGITEGASELVALHDALEEPLLELRCYRRENRPFTPHITLGRVKGERSVDLSGVLPKFASWSGGDVEVEEVVVMSSVLGPEGPTYAVLSRGRLRKAKRTMNDERGTENRE
jgi:2'-5' RNA ligase